ncbi:MAG: hypothetical protein E3J90_01690 [Promethearchaeota archaeon]|nr:MAG: hypothetical protein E3J90_01690 [Candidatus Lokiarchaeota archaeon]
MAAETYSGFAQRYSMVIGVLLSVLITNILFLILPTGFFFMGDIILIIGGSIGLFFTFKYRKEYQSHIKTGVIVGLTSSILSLLLIGFIDGIFYFILVYGFDVLLLLQYLLFLLMNYSILYVLVGVIMGYLFGNHYKKKEDPAQKTPYFKK